MYIVNTKVTIKIIQQKVIANKPTMEIKQDHKNAIQKKAEIEGERNKRYMELIEIKEQEGTCKTNQCLFLLY